MIDCVKGMLSLPGRIYALLLFLFLATQEISGISFIREFSEVALFATALWELFRRRQVDSGLFLNRVALPLAVFVLTLLVSCLYSPLVSASFGEAKTPIIKGMLLMPFAFSIVALALRRRGWSVEQISMLILLSFAASALGQLLWVTVVYGQHLLVHGAVPLDPYFHRYKVGALLIVFPFVVVLFFREAGVRAIILAIVIAALMMGIVTSNSRGAWLGMFSTLFYLVLVNRQAMRQWLLTNRKAAAVVIVGVLVMFSILAGTAMVEQVFARISSGLDSNARFGNGVWGATLDMIRMQPWFGYGYGDQVYSNAYNALAAYHPEWIVRESIGAHNALLAHWVAAGLPGVIGLLALYLGFFSGARQLLQREPPAGWSKSLMHACLAAIISYYIVRGQFEIVRWNSFGLMVAMLLWRYGIPMGKDTSAVEE